MLIRQSSDRALYLQIYTAIRADILEGRRRAGERLPPTRDLAQSLGVSRHTVTQAYEQLRAEGYLGGRHGSGTFVSEAVEQARLRTSSRHVTRAERTAQDSPVARLSQYGKALVATSEVPSSDAIVAKHPFDFRYGLPNTKAFPFALWARLASQCARSDDPMNLRYGAPEGNQALRIEIANHLRLQRGVECEPDQIIVVNGSQQAIDLIARMLIDKGDHVAMEDPGYPAARRVFLAAGAKIAFQAVDRDGLDPQRLMRLSSLNLVYVTPSHQFPTGAVMPLARRLRLLDWAEQNNAFIIEDDYDSEFRYQGHPIEAMQGLDRAGRVIYVGTFSKLLFPGLRTGFLVLPKALVPSFRAAKWLADRHNSQLEQRILAAFMRSGEFERHLRRSRARNDEQRVALLDQLTKSFGTTISVEGTRAGVHLVIWFKGRTAEDVASWAARAADFGVGVYPISPYFSRTPRNGGILVGYAALSVAEIVEGIARLKRVRFA